MCARNMSRFWNSKKRRFFKQSTALVVAGALLCSIVLPPFAQAGQRRVPAALSSPSSAQSHHLRGRLLTMNPKEAQERAREVMLSKQTLEKGIEFSQKLFKRTDTPYWMVAFVKIIYTPFLSAETWKLEIFDKNFIRDHNPVSLEELTQITQDRNLIFFAIGASFIYFSHSLSLFFLNQVGLDLVSSILFALTLSLPSSLFGVKAVTHSMINDYRFRRGQATLTKSGPELTRDKVLEILDRHNWNLGNATKELEWKVHLGYGKYFEQYRILDKFKEKLNKELDNRNWSVGTVAKRFGTNGNVINGFIQKFGLEKPSIVKEEALRILDKNKWNLGKSKDALGLKYGENIYEFFRGIGILDEFKEKLFVELKNMNWAVIAVAKRFGSNEPVIKGLIEKFNLKRPVIEKDKALMILIRNDWNLGKVKNTLGMNPGDEYYEYFRNIGILEELKEKLVEELKNKNWAVDTIAKRFDTFNIVINSFIKQFDLHRSMIEKDEALRILTENDWDLGKSKGLLGMHGHDSYYEFFQKIGIVHEFMEKLAEELEAKNWGIAAVAKRFGLNNHSIKNFINLHAFIKSKSSSNSQLSTERFLPIDERFLDEYNSLSKDLGIKDIKLERPIIGRGEVLSLLTKNNWDLGKSKEALGMNFGDEYYEYFQNIGILEEFKEKLVGELKAKNWAVVPVSKRFGISSITIKRLMEKFSLERPALSKEEALRVLDKNDWNLGKSKDALGMHSSDKYYEFFQQVGILEVFEVKLLEELKAKNWSVSAISKRFGTNDNTIIGLLKKFSLERPVLSKNKVLSVLTENDWDLRKSKDALGMNFGDEYYKFFQNVGILEEFKEKLVGELKNKNWSLNSVAKRFGTSDTVIKDILKKFGLEKSGLSKDKALSILVENNWNLEKSKEAFGMRNNEGYYEFFNIVRVLEEFKEKLIEELKVKRWSIKGVAKRFCTNEAIIKGFIKKFNLEKYAHSKDDVLTILTENNWDLEKSRDALGMRYGEDIYKFFQNVGMLNEFKEKLVEELKAKKWVLGPVSKRFGTSNRTVNGFIKQFNLVRPVPGKEEALRILEDNNWSLGKSKDALGMNFDDAYYEYFKNIGILKEFREKLIEELENKNGSILSVAERFGTHEPLINGFITHFSFEKPEKIEPKTIVIKEFSDFENLLTPELFSHLATRYSMDLRNILWVLVGSKLQGQYDEDKIKKLIKLIDKKILEFAGVEEKVKNDDINRDDDLRLVQATKLDEMVFLKPHTLSPIDLSQRQISDIARKLDKKIQDDLIDKALKEMARKQAVNLIRKLEENYLFKHYFSVNDKTFSGEEAKNKIEQVLAEEDGELMREILKEKLDEVDFIDYLHQELYSMGLRKITRLNLYQLVGVQRMLKEEKVLLADEMGLGKTLETISTFLLSGKEEMMVLGPKSSLSSWMKDLYKHTDLEVDLVVLTNELPQVDLTTNKKIHLTHITGTSSQSEYLSSRSPPSNSRKRIILINYESAAYFKPTSPLRTDFIALDEAHLLKNKNTKTSKMIYGDEKGVGAIEADYRIVITGTPLENKPKDLFGVLQYLSRGGNSKVEEMLSSIDIGRFSRVFGQASMERLSELHGYVVEKMIRRLKEDVVQGLPVKKFINIKLDPLKRTMKVEGNGNKTISLTGNYNRQIDLYNSALLNPNEFERSFGKRVPGEEDNQEEDVEIMGGKMSQILRLEQAATDPGIFGVSGSIKFDAATYLIDQRVEQGKSILIFTNFKTVANHFREYLIDQGYDPEDIAYVDGSVLGKERQEMIDRFQSKKSPIMIATTGTMGISVELTQANSILFLNYPWKPSTLDQAIDRAHRLTSKHKELEILTMELDLPVVSIDQLKSLVLKRKRILSNMLIEGFLVPAVLAAFHKTNLSISQKIEEYADNPVALDTYEMSVLQQLRLVLGKIIQTPDPEEFKRLWDEVSELYFQVLEHKGTFFANMASLDYLSGAEFPELKGKELEILDLASGPSTLYRAYIKKQGVLGNKQFQIGNIVDYDLSPQMLARGMQEDKSGVKREQIVGSFKDVGEAFREDQFDIVNLSYGIEYAQNPAKLIKDIHKILKKGGLFTLILHRDNVIPEHFIQALKRSGFDLKIGEGALLESELDSETYQHLVTEYGLEFAEDMAKYSRRKFTYLIANKVRESVEEVEDKEFRIAREIYKIDPDKIKKLQDPRARIKIIPLDEMTVEGEVTYDEGKKEKASLFNRSLRKITKLIGKISQITQKHTDLKETDESHEETKEKLNEEISNKLQQLRDLVEEELDQLNYSHKRAVLTDLQVLERRNKSRQWFTHHDHPLDDIQLMVMESMENDYSKENGNDHNGYANGENHGNGGSMVQIVPLLLGLFITFGLNGCYGVHSAETGQIFSQLLVAFAFPFIITIALIYKKLTGSKTQSIHYLKEILNIRKGVGEHPVNNLLYGLTHHTIEKNSSAQEELILVHLDRFDEFESEGTFHYAMLGITDYISQMEGKNVKVRFVKNSKNLEEEVETILERYPMLKKFILPSVQNPKEAIEKSTGYKIAYVITRVPEMWKGLVKNLVVLLSGGTEIILQGNIAREVMGMMNEMGFVGADGNYWNWMRGKLTIKEKNLKTKDLEKLKEPQLFKNQA